MRNIFEGYAESPKYFRRFLWKILHNYLIMRDKNFEVHFMNYGYYDEHAQLLELKEEDETERYCINLYHQNISDVEISGKDILEVGCGRGGGASYISRYFHPKSYIGLDLSNKAIRFCNENYNTPCLSFVRGKAEKLPFEDKSFDAVVNVESSRGYSDMESFLSEVHRVLKSKGHLLFSDMRTGEGNELLQQQFQNAKLNIISERKILPNVLKALDLDSERRKKMIEKKIPKFLHKSLHEFSGVKGSKRYQLFEDGTMGYFSYVLQKFD